MIEPDGVLDGDHGETVAVWFGVGHGQSDYPDPIKATQPSDAQIQLLSGHASKKSLEIYQHLSLDAVDAAYQQAVRLLDP